MASSNTAEQLFIDACIALECNNSDLLSAEYAQKKAEQESSQLTDTSFKPSLLAKSLESKHENVPQNVYILPSTTSVNNLLKTTTLEASETPHMSLAELNYNIQAHHSARLIALNNKVPTTELYKIGMLEARLAVTFTRIEDLKKQGLWSLHQRQRFEAPPRAPVLWDHILSEMKQLRASRLAAKRHKMAVCHQLSVGIKSMNVSNTVNNRQEGDDLSLADDLPLVMSPDVLSIIAQRVLDELEPMPAFSSDMFTDSYTNQDGIIPISKFVSIDPSPEFWKRVVFEPKPPSLEPPMESEPTKPLFKTKVENDTRPPQPPAVQNINSRVGGIWQPSEDAELLRLCREYPNNWLLVSSLLTTSGDLIASCERRTPWQTFERYVQLKNIEPKDFKGKYAEHARRWFELVIKAPPTARRKQTNAPAPTNAFVKGDKRARWSSMFDAVRKMKRKRETAPRPRLATAATLGIDTPPTSTGNIPSAMDLSRLKSERDKQIAEQFSRPRKPVNMSIAGLPMPASVIAAAKQRQEQFKPPFSRAQVQDFITQIAQAHPNLSPQEVQQIGAQNLRRYMNLQREKRHDGANGGGTTSGSAAGISGMPQVPTNKQTANFRGGNTVGSTQGGVQGPQGVSQSIPQGAPHGLHQSAPQGTPRGSPHGLHQGTPQGTPQGSPHSSHQSAPSVPVLPSVSASVSASVSTSVSRQGSPPIQVAQPRSAVHTPTLQRAQLPSQSHHASPNSTDTNADPLNHSMH